MKKKLASLLKILTVIVCLVAPAICLANDEVISSHTAFITEEAKLKLTTSLASDVQAFGGDFEKNILIENYVPIEAKVGRAFIGAMSLISDILERSLVRFMKVLMLVLFAFWIMFESYNLVKTGGDVKKLVESILKKSVMIVIWIWILNHNPAQLFMWVVGPVITIGTMLSDLILNSVAAASGASLPDTCAAIHEYSVAHHTGREIIDAAQTANLLCVPTRLSGFFYTAVAAGWKWMLAGIGTSAFTFIAGVTFIALFVYNIWKFALMALGVIADLFLGLVMLPFTAIAMTFGESEDKDYFGEKGATSYDGIAGKIYNHFLKIFTVEDLSKQITRFVNAAIYFVSLSIVIAFCAALLSGVFSADLSASVPSLESADFMTTLIVGCLVAYLANKAGDIASKLGGKIDDSKFGDKIQEDVKKIAGNVSKTAKSWWKARKS